MRRILLVITFACQVPAKQPLDDDGGTDVPTVDTVIDTTITAAPPSFSNSGSATFQFVANLATARFECGVDGERPIPCASPYTWILADGAHGFSVRAIDVSGRGDDTPAEHLWMIDTVAPDTELTAAPPVADNSDTVRFSFAADEENITLECSLDNRGYAQCWSDDEVGPLADGTHVFAVRARDRAGNVDVSPAIHAWSIDTSAPDTQLVSGPIAATASNTASFTFFSPDAGAGAELECSLDSSAFARCASPMSYSDLAEGDHVFAVRVRDRVGNYDPTPATRTWTVDLVAPDTTIHTGPIGTVAMASATVTFSANEENATFACGLDGGPSAPCTSPFNAIDLAQGAHSFTVAAIDAAGHTDPTPATRDWVVDTVTPMASSVHSQ